MSHVQLKHVCMGHFSLLVADEIVLAWKCSKKYFLDCKGSFELKSAVIWDVNAPSIRSNLGCECSFSELQWICNNSTFMFNCSFAKPFWLLFYSPYIIVKKKSWCHRGAQYLWIGHDICGRGILQKIMNFDIIHLNSHSGSCSLTRLNESISVAAKWYWLAVLDQDRIS